MNNVALYTHYYGSPPKNNYVLSMPWSAYSRLDYIDFIYLVITDDASEWERFYNNINVHSNIFIKYISISSFCEALKFLDLDFKSYFSKGELNAQKTGRDLCGLKPFLFLLDPQNLNYSKVGWIDTDTILSKHAFYRDYINEITEGSIGRFYKHGALALFDNSKIYKHFLKTDGRKSLYAWRKKRRAFRGWDDDSPNGFKDALKNFCQENSIALSVQDCTHYKFGIGSMPDDEAVFIFKNGLINCTIPKRSEFQNEGAMLCLDTFFKCRHYLNYVKENNICLSNGKHIFGWTTFHNIRGYHFAQKHNLVNQDGLEMWYCYKHEE